MKNIKFLFVLFSLLACVSVARAENSATAYDGKFYSQQVFVGAYNNSASAISRDNVVVLDTTATAGTNLGGYINTTTTTDNINVFGVTDESIGAGTMGRLCVFGPHKVVDITGQSGYHTANQIMATSTTAGQMAPYTTADGTAGGYLGYILNATATTDTVYASNTFWVWVNPQMHK